jgi:hypothetical protein
MLPSYETQPLATDFMNYSHPERQIQFANLLMEPNLVIQLVVRASLSFLNHQDLVTNLGRY